MKLNSLYYSPQKPSKTIKELDFLYSLLMEEIKKEFKYTKVEAPLFFEKSTPYIVDIAKESRYISFDSSSRKTINTINNESSLWLTSALQKYEVQDFETIMIHQKTIWRDLKETPNSSIVADKIVLEMKLPNEKAAKENLRSCTKKIYKIFEKISKQINKHLNKTYPILSSSPIYSDVQLLENEYKDLSFIEREKILLKENNSLILLNPGRQLMSNKYHIEDNPLLFNMDAQEVIVLNNKINNFPLHVAKISVRAFGDQLANQLRNFSQETLLENNLIRQIIDKELPISIQISIDRLLLALVLLNKGHIREVSPHPYPIDKMEKKLNTL